MESIKMPLTEYQKIPVELIPDTSSAEELSSTVEKLWLEEHFDLYRTVISDNLGLEGEALDAKVSDILSQEIKDITTDIRDNPQGNIDWRNWIGWINANRLLMVGLDPLAFQVK